MSAPFRRVIDKKTQPPHTVATAAAAHDDFGVANRFNLRQMCGTPGEVVALVCGQTSTQSHRRLNNLVGGFHNDSGWQPVCCMSVCYGEE